MFFLLVNIIVKKEKNIHLFDFIPFYARIYTQLKGLYMNYFDRKYNEIEIDSRRSEDKRAKAIYDALDQKFHISDFIDLDNVDAYIVKLFDILLFSGIPIVQQECLSLLRKENSNFRFFIPTLARILLLPSTPKELANFLAILIRDLNIYTPITIDESGLEIGMGENSAHIESAEKWVQEHHGYSIDTKTLSSQCHNVTFNLASYFPGYYATTILMANCLEGRCFHSFFSTPDNELIVDLATGTVVAKREFYSLIGCEEILNVPTHYLDGMYRDLCSRDDVPEEMSPVLALAIDNMRKR